MDIDKIISIIRAEIQAEFNRNYRSGNTKVAPHQHNTIDNLPVSYNNITDKPTLLTVADVLSAIPASSGGSLTVTDTITTVTGVTQMDFPSGSVTEVSPTEVSISVSAAAGGNDTDIQLNSGGSLSGTDSFTYTEYFIGFDLLSKVSIQGLTLSYINTFATISSPEDLTISCVFTLTIRNSGNGDITIESNRDTYFQTVGNFYFFNGLTAPPTGGGVGTISILDATTTPTSTPSGGGILYSSGGALHWRGSSGTDTVIAPA